MGQYSSAIFVFVNDSWDIASALWVSSAHWDYASGDHMFQVIDSMGWLWVVFSGICYDLTSRPNPGMMIAGIFLQNSRTIQLCVCVCVCLKKNNPE